MNFFGILAKKKILILLLTLFLGFNAYFYFQTKKINTIAGKDVQILDLSFGYTPEEVHLFYKTIGTKGCELYKQLAYVDILYPIVYGLLIIALLTFLLKEKNKKLLFLTLLPLFAILADWIENSSILKLSAQFPNLDVETVYFASLFTQTKWVFVGLSIISILFSLLLKKSKSPQG